jgi:hypothetical protein
VLASICATKAAQQIDLTVFSSDMGRAITSLASIDKPSMGYYRPAGQQGMHRMEIVC